MGYHIPNAEVCFLSPQVLLNTIGGKAIQTVQGINIILDNGFNVNAKFCPQSNLPLIPLSLKNNRKYCFWNNAFGFEAESFQEINTIKTILHQNNVNLSASQKRAPPVASTIVTCLSKLGSNFDARTKMASR